MFFFSKSKRKRSSRKAITPRTRLALEALESRLVPYGLSGNAWPHPELITIGFVPDGTVVGSNSQGYIYSNLHSVFDARFGSPQVWQEQILKAAQVWAQQTDINFAVIADNGAEIGTGDYQQGDPGMADIRIGGYNFGTTILAQAYMPPEANNYSVAGDIQFNTGRNFTIGGTYDLFTVAVHEIGHALGLYHSNGTAGGNSGTVMWASYTGVKSDLANDDINGIQANYSEGLPRTPDQHDQVAPNDSFLTATSLDALVDPVTLTGLVTDLDLTTSTDVDYFHSLVPVGTSGTFTVNLQSRGLSLLSPTLEVYAADEVTLLGWASAQADYDGAELSVTVEGVLEGDLVYIKVAGAETGPDGWQAFNTGRYALTLNFGTEPSPEVPLPNTQTLNGEEPSGGGGQATKVLDEFLINSTTTGTQTSPAVAADSLGNYVVVWRSDHTGSAEIYAQRFNASGVPQGSEFQVNTTTSNTQTDPSVAMAADGRFVVVWSGYQTGNYDIYAQRFDANGVAEGNQSRVNTYTSGSQKEAEVAMDANGNFVVVWTSYGQDGSGDGVYAQRFDAGGAAQGNEFRVNTTTANAQDDAAVAMDANGNFVVVWESNQQEFLGGEGVYGQRYNAAGVAQGSEFHVNTTIVGNQDTPSVGMDDAGNFVVAWQSELQDLFGQGIYARRYNAGGAALGGEFRVNTYILGNQQFTNTGLTADADGTVTMDADGDFIITWMSDLQDGSGSGIYLQQFDAQGVAQGPEVLVNSTYIGNQQAPAVAMTANGDFLVVWQGNGPGDADGIIGQRFTLTALAGLATADVHGYSEEGCTHGDQHHDHRDDGCNCPACTVAVDVAQRQEQEDALPIHPPAQSDHNSSLETVAGMLVNSRLRDRGNKDTSGDSQGSNRSHPARMAQGEPGATVQDWANAWQAVLGGAVGHDSASGCSWRECLDSCFAEADWFQL